METVIPVPNPVLFPLHISASMASLTADSGEKTAKQTDHLNDLPSGALPPKIPGHSLLNPYDISPRSEYSAMSAQYSPLNLTPQEGPYPFYTQAVNGPLLSQSPALSMGSPQMSPWARSSPEFSSSTTNHINAIPSSTAFPDMLLSDESVVFEPGPSQVQPPVHDYTRILQSVGQFPLESSQERLDDNQSEGSSLEEDDPMRFVNWALLSHIAVRLRDRVPRGTHVKGSVPYPRAFTGRDIVVSSYHAHYGNVPINDRSSPRYILKYNGRSSCISVVRQKIAERRCMLRVVFKVSYSFMKLNGIVGRCKME